MEKKRTDEKNRKKTIQSRLKYNRVNTDTAIRRNVSETAGGGRITRNNADYGIRRVNTETLRNNQNSRIRDTHESGRRITAAERRRRIERERKKRRMRKRRFRTAIIFAICICVAVMLVCMTPIFNVRKIVLNGNAVVTKEDIEGKIGDYIGKNLFSVNGGDIEQKLTELPQINKVEVKKNLIPPTVTLEIQESMPAAYLLIGNTIVTINSDLKVIDDSNRFSTDEIPSLSGISISSYKLNEHLTTNNEEKDEILRVLLTSFEKTGMLKKITYIGLDDLTNIKFTYDNRIETLCGSKLELERKIRMFAKVIDQSMFKSNAMGTLDLSVPGKAVYNSEAG